MPLPVLLLQCKDRHNGNIPVDSVGHLVHVDSGFILEISPGKNMRFESADFKLSHEMTQLLDPGGMRNSKFSTAPSRACAFAPSSLQRTIAEPGIACVALMKHCGLSCFERGDAVKSIRNRFHLDKNEKQVAAHIRSEVDNAYCKWTGRRLFTISCRTMRSDRGCVVYLGNVPGCESALSHSSGMVKCSRTREGDAAREDMPSDHCIKKRQNHSLTEKSIA